jgi:hypothetical protein
LSSNYSEKIERPSSQVGKIPDNLKASNILDDDFMNSVGLYSKKDIDEARFTRFSRFGRLLDPQGKLNDCREYLFFTKPDLHITKTGDEGIYQISGGKSSDIIQYDDLVLNPQLGGSPYFRSLLWSHPEVVKQLQREATANTNKDPFCRLLSSSVNSYLDIPGSEASTMDNPSTMLGATYDYLNNSENSDENPTFSLEFLDNKHLDVYHFFRAYSEYHILRKSGLVTPPNMKYYWYKRLHNVMGVYKFIVAEDMETIIKRKNIDLPVEVLQKLSLMAVAQGRSLKAYIEQILINKANSISIEVHENPSPSGDEWFENTDNMESVNRGIQEMKEGQGRAYTMDEIRKSLGV